MQLAFFLYALFLNLCNWLGRAAYVATLLLYVLGRYVLAAYLGIYNCFFIACHCSLVRSLLCFVQFFFVIGLHVFGIQDDFDVVLFQVVSCRKLLL